jgi:REP element-mobilizing transposase RayT
LLRQYAQQHGVSIWVYCLMDNHVDFVYPLQKSGDVEVKKNRHPFLPCRGNINQPRATLLG